MLPHCANTSDFPLVSELRGSILYAGLWTATPGCPWNTCQAMSTRPSTVTTLSPAGHGTHTCRTTSSCRFGVLVLEGATPPVLTSKPAVACPSQPALDRQRECSPSWQAMQPHCHSMSRQPVLQTLVARGWVQASRLI